MCTHCHCDLSKPTVFESRFPYPFSISFSNWNHPIILFALWGFISVRFVGEVWYKTGSNRQTIRQSDTTRDQACGLMIIQMMPEIWSFDLVLLFSWIWICFHDGFELHSFQAKLSLRISKAQWQGGVHPALNSQTIVTELNFSSYIIAAQLDFCITVKGWLFNIYYLLRRLQETTRPSMQKTSFLARPSRYHWLPFL